MRRSFTIMGLVIALLTGLAVSAAPTSAASVPASQANAFAPTAAELPAAFQAGAKRAGDCARYYLCVWKHAYYGSPKRAFYYCGFEDLVHKFWPGGFLDSMQKSISSLVNNQTSGTVSILWEYSLPSGGDFLEQVAYGYRDNLVIDGYNDKAASILVC